MAITPQAIKDQEFQVKFRGYDPIEVKAYLELIAEEFFELLERVRQQIDEMDVIVEERDNLKNDKTALQQELESATGSSEEIRSEVVDRDNEANKLRDEVEHLKREIVTLEVEKKASEQKFEGVNEQIQLRDEKLQEEKERTEKLINRVEGLMKQNEELRKEEIDFKSTLVAAQQFTNEVKRKSEDEAREMLNMTKAEVNRLRQDAYQELAKYPAEIQRLKDTRNKVRDDLEVLLKLTLENLEIYHDEEKDEVVEDDNSELFQSVQLNSPEEDNDDLDDINMAFDLPGTEENQEEEIFSMKEEMGNPSGDIR